MWLLTPFGFFSVVKKSGETNLQVRARVAADLEALRPYCPELGPTLHTPEADYACRALVEADAWGRALERIGSQIDYNNFKNEVYRRQGSWRAHLYGKIWGVLYELQAKSKSGRV